LFDYSESKGMNIELILWTYGAKGGNKMWGNSRYENFWIDTLVNRYKNRKNLFMYTITNEFERYPDGVYSFSSSDVEWVKNIAQRIRSIDPVHVIGAHPSHWISQIPPHNKFNTYNGFTQKLPQVVWPLWENSAINVYNVQNNQGVQKTYWGRCSDSKSGCAVYEPTEWQGMNYPATWTRAGWDVEGAGMEDSIAEDWLHGRPVINTEFGYQYESGAEASDPSFNTRQANLPKTIRKKAWKIVTSGGYFAAGFVHTSVHFNAAKLHDWRPQQLEVLYDFFTRKTEFWKMAPRLELVADHNSCLALPGTEYVAYFPRGGTNRITLQAGKYSVEWLKPETGVYYQKGMIAVSEGDHRFTPPGDTRADWVLHVVGESRFRSHLRYLPPSTATSNFPVDVR